MRAINFRKMFVPAILAAIVFGVSMTSCTTTVKKKGATTVKKNISEDTVWRAKKSPYVVRENIMLEKGATLTIERGVRVELEPGISIQVRGKLVAIGTPENPITFTAHEDEPWKNIYFTDFSPDGVVSEDGGYIGGCIMKHCIVEKGNGIYVRFGGPLITECIIRDNLSSGIRVEFGAPKIVRNRIFGNSTQSESASGNGGGIIAYTDKPVLIADNIINNNISDGGRDGGGGIYVYAADGAQIVVRNNTLFANKSSRLGGGIYAYGGIIEGNTVIGNEAVERGGGICAIESQIVGNLVQSNTAGRGGGVYAESGDVESNSIIRNVALRPEGGALYYFGSGNILSNSLVSNIASKDGGCGGIYVSGNPEIRANNLFNNSGYALYVANVADAPEVSATGNFWGAASERAVLDLAYDWLDNENTGLADYMPYLEEMSAEAPLPPPFNLTAVAGKDRIKLSWEKPAGASPKGHKIYLGTNSGYPYDRVIPAGAENGYEIKGLERGTEYWVAVSAYDVANGKETESGLSEEARIMVTGSVESVARPKNLSSADNGSDISKGVVLKASDSDKGVAASRWQVSTAAADFSALAIDEALSDGKLSSLKLGPESLIGGQKYFWRVAYRASNGSWSDWSEPTSFATAADGPSIISGPIASALTLEKKFSPYIVAGNTLITPQGEVKIEPGVEIRVAPGKHLMVRGKLAARGTKAEPIKFTKQASENWGHIIFADQSVDCGLDDDGAYADGCILERCLVEHGKGLLIESSSPLIKDCNIANNDGSGITVRRGGPVITGNDIYDNVAPTNGGGVYAYTNDIIFVTRNKIRDNRADGDGGGVFAYGYMNTSTIRVEDNEITGNTAGGDGGGVYLSRSSAVGNKVESNSADGGGGGIFATFGLVDANELRNNRADKGGGIFAERNSSLTDNLVTSNIALSGFGGGVYINFWGISIDNETFTRNTVTRNTARGDDANGGVFIVGYLYFERNNIHGNGGSQLYNGNEPESYSLSTTQCYWGTSDKSAISKLIVDGSDDPQLGKVSFEPFAPNPLRFD